MLDRKTSMNNVEIAREELVSRRPGSSNTGFEGHFFLVADVLWPMLWISYPNQWIHPLSRIPLFPDFRAFNNSIASFIEF